MEKQKQGNVPRNIENRFGSIGKTDHSNIEVNIIRWNNGRKKLDIRVWSSDGKCPKKGVTFNREEYFQLIRILSGIDPMLIDCGKAFAKESAEQQREQAAAAGDQISSYQDEVRGALETAEEDDYVELDKTEPEEDASSSAAS